MALRALETYRHAISSGAVDVRPELHDRPDPFDTGQLHEARSVEASRALAELRHPAIIVAASGMASGGRVLHHLRRLPPDDRYAVVLVRFQAGGTRGRQLADGASQLKMFGKYVRVRAEIVNIASFSVHADHGELVAWLEGSSTLPETVYLVHGEQSGRQLLRDSIEAELDIATVIPSDLERVSLV